MNLWFSCRKNSVEITLTYPLLPCGSSCNSCLTVAAATYYCSFIYSSRLPLASDDCLLPGQQHTSHHVASHHVTSDHRHHIIHSWGRGNVDYRRFCSPTFTTHNISTLFFFGYVSFLSWWVFWQIIIDRYMTKAKKNRIIIRYRFRYRSVQRFLDIINVKEYNFLWGQMMIVIEPQYAIVSTSYIIMARLHANRWMLEASSPSSIRQTEELAVVVVDSVIPYHFCGRFCFFFCSQNLWKVEIYDILLWLFFIIMPFYNFAISIVHPSIVSYSRPIFPTGCCCRWWRWWWFQCRSLRLTLNLNLMWRCCYCYCHFE